MLPIAILTLLAATVRAAVLDARAPVVFPSGWQTLIPCAVDTPDRILRSVVIKQLDDNSASRCMAICDNLGYNYAGTEYGNECARCRCCLTHVTEFLKATAGAVWSRASRPPRRTSAAWCVCLSEYLRWLRHGQACAGDATQSCGGSWRMQLYYTLSTVSKNPTIPAGWAVAAACAVDVGDRVIKDDYLLTIPNNTPALCMTTCGGKGYSYAGVEFSTCVLGSALVVRPG